MHFISMVSGVLLALYCSGVAAAAPVLYNETSKFTFIDIPTPLAGPCDMEVGPDGYLYVQYLFAEKVARVDPVSNTVIKEFDIPYNGPKLPKPLQPVEGIALGACVIRAGTDGNLYLANGLRNNLVLFDLKTETLQTFTPPNPGAALGNLQPFNDMWGTPEGMYYSQSSADIISLFDYNTHKFTNFKVPTPLSLPLGMRSAADGALWFTELGAQKIARLNHTSGVIKEYSIANPKLFGPAVMRVETDNDKLWFTAAVGNSIGSIDINSGQFTAYPNTGPVDPIAVPSEDTMDNDGRIWFCTWTQNILHYLDPKSGQMTHIAIPAGPGQQYVDQPYDIGVGIIYYGVNDKNRIYFTQSAINRMGFYDLD